MARFFIPPDSTSSPGAERAYRGLRDQAEACIGATSRERRIEGIECRRSGRDCLLRVGELDAGNGRTVAAIIQVGRDNYTIHHLGVDPSCPPDPIVLRRVDVYEVTDFQ